MLARIVRSGRRVALPHSVECRTCNPSMRRILVEPVAACSLAVNRSDFAEPSRRSAPADASRGKRLILRMQLVVALVVRVQTHLHLDIAWALEQSPAELPELGLRAVSGIMPRGALVSMIVRF